MSAPEAPKSKRPANTGFKQQRLKAWQPFLTPKTVLPTFFVIGIVFIPIGIVLISSSNGVKELSIDYTNCFYESGSGPVNCADSVDTMNSSPCTCEVEFTLTEKWEGQVYLYYALTNFYQNHRRYVKSRDDAQLAGGDPTVVANCDPVQSEDVVKVISGNNVTVTENFAPCGLIANSFFNDKVTSLKHENGDGVFLNGRDITWKSDRDTKYKNPPVTGDSKVEANRQAAFAGTVSPPNWGNIGPVYNLGDTNGEYWGYKDEDLINWFRVAALPNFRKLWRKVGDSSGLAAGKYTFTLTYQFPTKIYDGTKSLVLSTTSFLGGKNPFLGYAYVVVGVISLVLGVAFLLRHCMAPRQLGDPQYLKWNE